MRFVGATERTKGQRARVEAMVSKRASDAAMGICWNRSAIEMACLYLNSLRKRKKVLAAGQDVRMLNVSTCTQKVHVPMVGGTDGN